MKSAIDISMLSDGTEPNPFMKISVRKRINDLWSGIKYVTEQLFIDQGVRYVLTDVSIIDEGMAVRCRMVGLFIKH